MKNIMLFGLLSACAVAATGCNSDDKDAKIIERPAPEEKKTDGKEAANTAKIAELQSKKDAAEAKVKEAEKKAADAEAELKKAAAEKANPETLAKLTAERDEAKKAADAATADLASLRALEATVVSQYQGDWTSNETILGTECVTLVRVKDKGFQKLISCSTDSGVADLNQYEQGSLEGITVSTAGRVTADFAVKNTSCQWRDGEKIVPVGFISESGSFKAATSKKGSVLTFGHPVREEVKTLTRSDDVCKDATGLTATACAFLADSQAIEPNHQVGCFVYDTAPDYRHTKEITEIK